MTPTPASPPDKTRSAAKRSVFVGAAALIMFISAIFGFYWFHSSAPIKTVIKLERIHLDRNAVRASGLVQMTPLSLDIERLAILSDEFVEKALDQSAPARSQDQTTGAQLLASLDDDDERDGRNDLSRQVLRYLRVDVGPNSNELLITFPRRIMPDDRSGIDVVNTIIDHYVDLRNRERKRQKDQVLIWADGKLAYWRDTMARLNAEKDDAIATTNRTAPAGQTEIGRLLTLFANATRSAQDEALKKIQGAVDGSSDQQRTPLINSLEQDFATLGHDVERWETIATVVNQPTSSNAADLRRTEMELEIFKEELDMLISSGMLDKPAASVMQKASAVSPISLFQWAVAIPTSAAVSIILAILFALIVFRRSSSQKAESSMLNDPYWPMKRQ